MASTVGFCVILFEDGIIMPNVVQVAGVPPEMF